MVLPTRRNLSHVVAADVVARIRAGEYRPGDRLPTEKGLMERYGVGRNTAREAVQSLVARGFLDVRPGRGAVVVAIPSDDAIQPDMVSALLADEAVTDLYDFRRIVEAEVAAGAAIRATEADVQRIEEALQGYQHALESGGAVFQADIAFHEAVARASHNIVFVRVLDALADLLTVARQQTDHVPGAKERALDQHRAILAAVALGDERRARHVMTEHIRSAIDALGKVRRHELETTPGTEASPDPPRHNIATAG